MVLLQVFITVKKGSIKSTFSKSDSLIKKQHIRQCSVDVQMARNIKRGSYHYCSLRIQEKKRDRDIVFAYKINFLS